MRSQFPAPLLSACSFCHVGMVEGQQHGFLYRKEKLSMIFCPSGTEIPQGRGERYIYVGEPQGAEAAAPSTHTHAQPNLMVDFTKVIC